MKKIALVAALPFALTLAACGETAEEEVVVEETPAMAEPAPMEPAPMAEDTMAPADGTMTEEGTTATDPMMEEGTATTEDEAGM